MHVRIEIRAIQLFPRLAAICGLEGAADLDPNEERFRIARIEGDGLHMAEVRLAGEGPVFHAGDVAQAGVVLPGLAKVGAEPEVGGLGAGIDTDLIADLITVEAVKVVVADAGVATLPGVPAVFAGP